MVHRNQRQLDDEQLQQVELMFKQNKSKPAEMQELIRNILFARNYIYILY